MKFLATCIAAILFIATANSQVKLPSLISDSMVLQRDVPLHIWGWASAGEKIKLRFGKKNIEIVTGADGKWQTILPAMPAGGPFTMDITGSNHLVIKDMLIGDVWMCSGQSNMVLPMERVKEKYPETIAAATNSEIRNFFIPTIADAAQLHDDIPKAHWAGATPKNVLDFGAASYFFALKIYASQHVPIGIINASVGGTPIEAWISEEGFKGFPAEEAMIGKLKDSSYTNGIARAVAAARLSAPAPPKQTDKGSSGPLSWFDVRYQPEGWHTMMVPGYWADQGVKGLNGVVWFRKEIELTAEMAAQPAKLFLGRIIDADQAYVNGVAVGNITYQYPPRRYTIPAGVLKAGKNILVVRITNTAGKGGFVPDKNYSLVTGTQKLDLRGEWQYKVGQVFEPWKNTGAGVAPIVMQNQPTGLYNAMIAPLINYPVKGFLWYQGEANAGSFMAASKYQFFLPALIQDWRAHWNQGKLPFIFVQLPNFNEVQYSPAESDWAVLREGELKSLAVPNTGMAVTIDLGEWNDIHPLNKKDVGERLALAAEKLAYGNESIVYSGPLSTGSRRDGNKIIVDFASVGSGLMVKGGDDLYYFAIAGKDKKFVWANARIEGKQVIVWNDDISEPVYLRYAWADNPEGANLYNKEGLPASPFQFNLLEK